MRKPVWSGSCRPANAPCRWCLSSPRVLQLDALTGVTCGSERHWIAALAKLHTHLEMPTARGHPLLSAHPRGCC